MLNFNNVTVRLGGRTILDRASAALPPGARVGLIGRNGAGKSTLMRVIAGLGEADDGGVEMPKGARLGYVAQETPAGEATPLETVLAADVERAALLAEAEHTHDADRIGHIYERLEAIDAHSAPARASRILVGLGFDEAAQNLPLDSFSGGWRMRVALGALLFSEPDVLLLDEPSNHLDLESTLWLESFLRSYRATMLVVSHERDLLNNVVDHILHLEGGKTTLYVGGYDAFERQRAERQNQLAAAREKQAAQREKLKEFVAKNSARASTAKQAQSRVKALARMQPIAEAAIDPSLSFSFPSPPELKPPLLTLDETSVGYGERTVLSHLDMRLDPEERIALLGRNGNGKTTLARLLAGQLEPMGGGVFKAGKLTVGYFTQYQVEELDSGDTPLEHMARAMKGASPGLVRAQLGRFGFSGDKAMTRVGKLSGGERARLALALITRDAPHLLILDEPTNHLDVDAREALVHALNDYGGAVVVVSHDRHMLELTADRLMLVDAGTAKEFTGSLDDYTDFVLGKGPKKAANDAGGGGGGKGSKQDRKAAARARDASQGIRKTAAAAEAEVTRLTTRLSAIDRALFDPKAADAVDAKATVTELMQRRGGIERELASAEAGWLAGGERSSRAGGGGVAGSGHSERPPPCGEGLEGKLGSRQDGGGRNP